MATSPPLEFVDTHCHLNLDEFETDRGEVITQARMNGISRIIIPGINLESSKAAILWANDYEQVYAAVGVHPNDGLSWTEESVIEIERLAGEEKVVAIGEIGLDYYRDNTPKELQRTIFIQQLELAAEMGLPVIVHNRDASEEIMDILINWQAELAARGSKLTNHPGVLHSFSGSVEMAQQMVEHHFQIGITGAVTFKNAQNLQKAVITLPLASLLLETDSPYQTPHPFRGKRNEPSNVRIVGEKIAELKATAMEEVAKVTTQEADKLFNWREFH